MRCYVVEKLKICKATRISEQDNKILNQSGCQLHSPSSLIWSSTLPPLTPMAPVKSNASWQLTQNGTYCCSNAGCQQHEGWESAATVANAPTWWWTGTGGWRIMIFFSGGSFFSTATVKCNIYVIIMYNIIRSFKQYYRWAFLSIFY